MPVTEDDLDSLIGEEEEEEKKPETTGDGNPAEYAEAFGRSFVRGTPFVGSYSDEVEAAARAAKDALANKDLASFQKHYEQYKKIARNRNQELEQNYPVTSGLGTAAQLAMPYGAIAKAPGLLGKVGQFLFPASLKMKIPAGAIQGGMYQAGRLGESGGYDESGNLTQTGAMSLAEASLGGGGMAGASRIPKKDVGQNMLSVLFGPKPEMQQRYLNDPQGVKNSTTLPLLSEGISDDYRNLRRNISRESGIAYNMLDDADGSFNLRQAIDRIDESIGRLKKSGDITPKGQEALENLQKQRANLIGKYPQLKEKATIPEKKPVDFVDFVNEAWNPPKPQPKPMSIDRRMQEIKIPFGEAKDYLQGLDKMIDYKSEYNPRAKREFSGLRSDIDKKIKDVSDEYAQQMKKVNAMRSVEEQGYDAFGKKRQGSILSGLKQESSKYGIPIPKEKALRSLGDLLGKDFIKEAKDIQARQAFESTYANGSANVNLWRMLAAPVGKLGWDKEFTDAAGAIAGRTFDRFGPKAAQKILDLQMFLQKAPVIKQALDTAAQSEGAKNFMVTDMLLRKKYPEYREIMEDLMPILNKDDDETLPDLEDLK